MNMNLNGKRNFDLARYFFRVNYIAARNNLVADGDSFVSYHIE